MSSSSISISERFDETYTLQLFRYFNENTKLNTNVSPAMFVILKDKCNDISDDISPSSIFSMKKKNIYVTSKVINKDYNEEQLQYIENKMKQITGNANNKYNQWIAMKLDKEVDKWKPLFLVLWAKHIEPTMTTTQGSNTCIGQTYTDYCWFPIMFIIVGLICLFTYPFLYIYDCLSGRSKALANIVQAKVKSDGYQYTEQIDLYIYEELKSLASEVKVPNVKLESGVVLYDYIVVDSGVDGDSVLKHYADKFVLRFVHSNNNNNDVIVSINDDVNIVSINDKNDSKYVGLPTDDV